MLSSARWLHDALPDSLNRPAWFGTELWQWLVVPVLLVVTVLVAVGLTALASAGARRFAARADATAEAIALQLKAPLRLLFVAALCWVWLPGLQLPADWQDWVVAFARAMLGLAFFWGLFRAIALVADRVSGSPWVLARPGSRSLVSLGARLARIALLAAGVVTVLGALGYPVASLIAGLGIGGLALALAAQKTVENLFGAFALAVDQPFREGDFVKVDDFFSGTVEQIGMRSTRFRTVERTVITIPNGKLADSRLESFAARDRVRFACTLNLARETTAAQLKKVLEGAEAALRAQPQLWPEGVSVKLVTLGQQSFDVEVNAFFATADVGQFQQFRQEVLLALLEVVEKAGTSLAYPTRAVHVLK